MNIHDILPHLNSVRGSNGRYQARCPIHDDQNPSLSIQEKNDKILIHCHAGCSQDDLWKWVRSKVKKEIKEEKPSGLLLSQYASYLGLNSIDLQSFGVMQSAYQNRPAIAFEYRDWEGNLLYKRWRIALNGDRFRYDKGVRPILYGQWRFGENEHSTILAEGESDIHILWHLKFRALGIPCATYSFSDEDWQRISLCKKILIFVEDEAGVLGAHRWMQNCPVAEKVEFLISPKLAGTGQEKDIRDIYVRCEEKTRDSLKRALLQLKRLNWNEFQEEFSVKTESHSTHSVSISKEEFEYTDYANAERFVARFGHDFRYHVRWRRWLIYDGKRWIEDEKKEIELKMIESIKTFGHEAIEKGDKKAIKWTERSFSTRAIQEALRAAQALLPISPSDLDQDPNLLNLENGTFDLVMNELREHDRNDFITKLAPVEYHADAKLIRWLQHLEMFLPDPDVRRTLQRHLGLGIFGGHAEEMIPIWHGSGANGKSTTLKVILDVLGKDYAGIAPPNLLQQGDRHPTELADLEGRRLLFAVELGRSALALDRLKWLTGGEPLKVRRMHADFYEIQPSWLIVGITNQMPVVKAQDEGTWRRIVKIPWTVQVPESMRRPQGEILAELVSEKNGILNWLIAGYQDWCREPFWNASVIQQATSDYREEEDPFAEFMNENIIFDENARESASELYHQYQLWCESQVPPEKVYSKHAFGRYFAERGFQASRSHGKRFWHGLKLKNQTENDGGEK